MGPTQVLAAAAGGADQGRKGDEHAAPASRGAEAGPGGAAGGSAGDAEERAADAGAQGRGVGAACVVDGQAGREEGRGRGRRQPAVRGQEADVQGAQVAEDDGGPGEPPADAGQEHAGEDCAVQGGA